MNIGFAINHYLYKQLVLKPHEMLPLGSMLIGASNVSPSTLLLSQVFCLRMKSLTLVDAIDIEMKCSTGFAHQPDVISLLNVG